MGTDDERPLSTVFEFQQQLNDALLEGSTAAGERGTELTKRTIEGQLDLIEETIPGAS